MLKDELEYYIAHQEELVDKYHGKVLVIKGLRIIGIYDTPLQAYLDTKKTYEPGTFLIQQCENGPEAYTVTLSPLMAF